MKKQNEDLETTLLKTFPGSIKIMTTEKQKSTLTCTINIPLTQAYQYSLAQITDLVVKEIKKESTTLVKFDCLGIKTTDNFGINWLLKTKKEIEDNNTKLSLINVSHLGLVGLGLQLIL